MCDVDLAFCYRRCDVYANAEMDILQYSNVRAEPVCMSQSRRTGIIYWNVGTKNTIIQK